jgi:uncharacterized ferritin-like protein (DUF455 family)
MSCLRTRARALWAIADPLAKASAVQDIDAGSHQVYSMRNLDAPDEVPGRPPLPRMVAPRHLPRRALTTPAGRAALIHALAHIEFNAINLALDAVWRFARMPQTYYQDWFGVAVEEARHFILLRNHLVALGFDYGSFDAHDGLWEMAAKTRCSVLARMGLVPRLLEARGLDASPAIRDKLRQAGDDAAARIVDIILQDEVRHVAVGNQWFAYLCALESVQPIAMFEHLLATYAVAPPRPPFNLEARRAAGFDTDEINALLSMAR